MYIYCTINNIYHSAGNLLIQNEQTDLRQSCKRQSVSKDCTCVHQTGVYIRKEFGIEFWYIKGKDL